MIGRNNSGKTSFLVLFDKFFNGIPFDYNDFSISLRDEIENINTNSVVTDISIQLILEIKYDENDDLSNLSEFMMDLDPERRDVNILFECSINKERLLEAIASNSRISKTRFIKKYLSEYLDKKVYVFNDMNDLKAENRNRIIKKEIDDVNKLIDFEIIHAKRSVSSSDEKTSHKVLSGLTTNFYNATNESTPEKFEGINSLIESMDLRLEEEYDKFFSDFLQNARDFLSLDDLKIISNLKANEILNDSSEVIYGNSQNYLPEYLNGLGYLNILYLLLTIEIIKRKFEDNKKDIKLLFIEEPEAHTHPQLQYIFARKIASLLCDVCGLQTIITTHSPHIVANHPFENIRYMLIRKDDAGFDNIEIKNFYHDLNEKYKDEQSEFQFLKQYLSIESAELFFASKVIFIEGISENMLLPNFIADYDEEQLNKENEYLKLHPKEKAVYLPISAQNVTILQVGANAKAFRYFLEFLNISTLIITDIDTTKLQDGKYVSCPVSDNPDNTSNATIKYYYNAPNFKNKADFNDWLSQLISEQVTCISNSIKVSYQKQENGYHARSFEDAFININHETIRDHINEIDGLTNEDYYKQSMNIYDLTDGTIRKKSDFAASILFLAHTKNIKWDIPLYIREGLDWIQKN
jgi:predicted ATP-dependent endonuclease of OLD family